jgi:acetylornithine/succinyldiaminopimelate/putrescine aminotransferase
VLDHLQIVKGRNDVLIAADGQEYVDLIAGFGALLLGHCREPIVERVRRQLDDVWLTGRLNVPVIAEARDLVESQIGSPYRLVQFCSGGAEAIEFAIRIAAVTSGRKAFVGFSGSMHGKSVAASALCWGRQFVELQNLCTLPFVSTDPEAAILAQLEQRLASNAVAAVFLELIQGTSGAHEASPAFYREVGELCREHGTLCIVDEMLTGFYRSGSLSYSREIGLSPDILVFGKALGNGFPAAAVLCRDGIEITKAMLPGSTYSDNPLAAAAVAASLAEMTRLDVMSRTAVIHRTAVERLAPLREHGIAIRGRGALWVLELPHGASTLQVQKTALSANVLVSVHGQYVRLLPPATISRENLQYALGAVGDACLGSLDG